MRAVQRPKILPIYTHINVQKNNICLPGEIVTANALFNLLKSTHCLRPIGSISMPSSVKIFQMSNACSMAWPPGMLIVLYAS